MRRVTVLIPGILRDLALPTIFTVLAAIAFFTLERVRPGRELPNSRGWYGRAVLVNLRADRDHARHQHAVAEAVRRRVGVSPCGAQDAGASKASSAGSSARSSSTGGTACAIMKVFWEIFHQVHHSPARIEAITSFYKHPVEILADSALAAAILYLAARLLARRRAVVQFLRGDRRVLLSRQLQVAALAEVHHPDAGAALGASRARRAPLQLRRPADLGPPVRHLSRRRHVRGAMRLPAPQRAQARAHAGVPERVQRSNSRLTAAAADRR